MTLFVIALYLCLVLGVGVASRIRLQSTGEDYFVASRSIGPLLLLLSLFGTHMTAFSLLGASGEAYRRGIGVFALMASSSALVVPVVFLFVGRPLWRLGRRHGFVTQTELFEARWGSAVVGKLLLPIVVLFLLPYLLIGIKGAGLTLSQITSGVIAEWVGSLLLCAVVLTYVSLGGARGTAWANALQTTVFVVLGGVATLLILRSVGGLEAILDSAQRERPELLVRGDLITPREMLSYTLVPLSVGMFPHLFMHWLTARSQAAFRLPVVAYPLCVAAVWLPSVLLGVVGAVVLPGLEGPAASSILIRLIEGHTPAIMAGVLAAGVLAAVMSSLDSQVLALGTLISRGLGGAQGSETRQLFWGRLGVALVMVVAFVLAITVESTIFRLGIWSFTGFTGLLPLVLAALYWRRSTATGAVACLLTTAIGWSVLLWRSWGHGHGAPPIAQLLLASAAALLLGSWFSQAPSTAHLGRFFGEGSEESV